MRPLEAALSGSYQNLADEVIYRHNISEQVVKTSYKKLKKYTIIFQSLKRGAAAQRNMKKILKAGTGYTLERRSFQSWLCNLHYCRKDNNKQYLHKNLRKTRKIRKTRKK